MIDNKLYKVKHDSLVLEGLLMSFGIEEARKKSLVICDFYSDYDKLMNCDFVEYGQDRDSIKLAVLAYTKILKYLNGDYRR